MNSKQLIDGIKRICRQNHVDLGDVRINYRHDYDSDIWCVRDVALADSTFMPRARVTRWLNESAGLTGREFIDRLEYGCRFHDVTPEKVQAEIFYGSNAAYPIRAVEEDLFDAESGSVLETLMLVSDTSDK